MKTNKLYPISQGAIEVMDYVRKALTATIAVDGFDDTDDVELNQEDILSTAMTYGLIGSYYDPDREGRNYRAEYHDGKNVDFFEFWDNIDPVDTEKIFEGAIVTKAAMGLEATYRELFTRIAA